MERGRPCHLLQQEYVRTFLLDKPGEGLQAVAEAPEPGPIVPQISAHDGKWPGMARPTGGRQGMAGALQRRRHIEAGTSMKVLD